MGAGMLSMPKASCSTMFLELPRGKRRQSAPPHWTCWAHCFLPAWQPPRVPLPLQGPALGSCPTGPLAWSLALPSLDQIPEQGLVRGTGPGCTLHTMGSWRTQSSQHVPPCQCGRDCTGRSRRSACPCDVRSGLTCPSSPPSTPSSQPWEEQHLLLQCETLVEPSKSVLVLPGQLRQWLWPNSGW